MGPAIRVAGLGKRYRINHELQRSGYRTLRESLGDLASSAFRRRGGGAGDGRVEEFWALRGIDFEIQPGEVVGIIGRNGAGKSTLLKVLSRITRPTTGQVEFQGRMSSLLEVGTGFHPELTGRENIFLNGAILGMGRHEITRKFDEIVAFAGINRFLDTPVKRFSSGMYVRLAFAVAAHLEREILVVDEVLAVGDAAFQKKCLGKMQDMTRLGRTVLFVSHNMGSISSLCRHAYWLEEGRLKKQGLARDIIQEYLGDTTLGKDRHLDLSSSWGNHPGPLALRTLEWPGEFPVKHGEPLTVRVHYEARANIEDVVIGLGISSLEGTRILTIDSDDGNPSRSLTEGERGWVEMTIDRLTVVPGVYALDLGARSGDRSTLGFRSGVALIEILPGPSTPPLYVCYPGAGVRHTPACQWGRD